MTCVYKDPPLLLYQYTNQYSALKDSIVSRRQLVTLRDFPSSGIEVRQMLQKFRTLRTTEDPVRIKEMETLVKMANELSLSNLTIPPIEAIEEVCYFISVLNYN